MAKRARIILLLATGLALPARGQETVGTPGSDIRFATKTTHVIDGKEVKLQLTGTGLREKFFVNVYAVGSYIPPGAPVKDAQGLAKADVPKLLQLVFERDVDGEEMVDGLTTGITYNYSKKEFANELASLGAYMRAKPLKRGDQVWITHVPGYGLSVTISGRDKPVNIPSLKFARAVWDIYVGPKNLGQHIKSGLTSRL